MSSVTLLDTTLRDGSHAVSHQHSVSDTTAVVSSLAGAGVEVIEVAHGDGLGGSSVHFGIGRESDLAHIDAAVAAAGTAKICALVVPGLGTADGIRAAAARGLGAVRVATHVTEANLARPHLAAAKDAGLLAVGFLMMTHMASPAQVADSASELESYGAEVVYLADSAGHQIVEDIARRVEAIVSRLEVAVGVHTHNNLGLAIANALAAAQAGATYIDGTLCGLGAGAGNAQLEVLVAVLERAGFSSSVDLDAVIEIAETVGRPLLRRPQVVDADSLLIGLAGLYSTFLLPTRHAAERYGVPTGSILRELGKRQLVAGQEDMIIDVAYGLSESQIAQGRQSSGLSTSPGQE
jgi:4-hydroxy-2-oxovalerate aldolase